MPSTSWRNRPGKPRHQLRDVAAGGLALDRDRDGVAVVLDQEDHRQALEAGDVERLPRIRLRWWRLRRQLTSVTSSDSGSR